MSPIEYLIWYYTSGAYKKRVAFITCLLALKGTKPVTPVLGQIAYFDKQHHLWKDDDWQLLSPSTYTDKPASMYLHYHTPVTLQAGMLPNVTQDITTTVGNVLTNILCVINPFHDRIPFLTGKISAGRIEAYIQDQLVDEGQDGITPAMFNTYVIAMRLLMSVSGMFIASATRKNILPPPGIKEFKQQLDRKYDVTDKLQQAKYVGELIKYDEEYLKDDPSLGILMSAKSKNKARIKLYSAFGVETSFGVGNTTKFIKEDLNSGIPTDSTTHAELYTSMRAASYSRGKLTAIGGVLAKLLARLTAEVSVLDTDCGTTRYTTAILRKGHKHYEGRYIVDKGKLVLLTASTIGEYDGQTVQMRSPGYCKSDGTTYCRYCSGEKMFANKDSIRVVSQDTAGRVLLLMLAAFHGLDSSATKIPFDDISF